MIQEVDAALEALVRRDALNGARVEVVFDAPTKEWVARRNAPTINLYLYDIREDLSRRQVARVPFRDAGTSFVTEHRMPPRRFRLSYLVTAWTQRPEDEHRLLSACLTTLVRNEIIPLDLTSGSLAASDYPVILSVALPLPAERSIADVWSALGGELKPSLDLTAIAPLDTAWSEPAAKPVLEGPVLGVGGPGIDAEQAGGTGGRRGLGGRGRGRGRTGGDLQPSEPALQTELVRAGEVGVRATGAQAADGSKRAKRPIDAEPATEPDLAGLGGGRIVRVRGISRP
jgi:hypothetical protein